MKTKSKKIRESWNDWLFRNLLTAFLVIFACIMAVPLIAELAVSLSSKAASDMNAINLWPVGFTFDSWEFLLKQSTLWRAFFISVTSTVITVVLAQLINAWLAYPLSKNIRKYQKFLKLIYQGQLSDDGLQRIFQSARELMYEMHVVSRNPEVHLDFLMGGLSGVLRGFVMEEYMATDEELIDLLIRLMYGVLWGYRIIEKKLNDERPEHFYTDEMPEKEEPSIWKQKSGKQKQ